MSRKMHEFSKELAGGRSLISSGWGEVVQTPLFDGKKMIVRLRGVHDRQLLTLRLAGVRDVYGARINASLRVGLLLGDATGEGVVNNADVTLIRASMGNVTANNFRADVIADGLIDEEDRAETRSHVGQRLATSSKFAEK